MFLLFTWEIQDSGIQELTISRNLPFASNKGWRAQKSFKMQTVTHQDKTLITRKFESNQKKESDSKVG